MKSQAPLPPGRNTRPKRSLNLKEAPKTLRDGNLGMRLPPLLPPPLPPLLFLQVPPKNPPRKLRKKVVGVGVVEEWEAEEEEEKEEEGEGREQLVRSGHGTTQ